MTLRECQHLCLADGNCGAIYGSDCSRADTAVALLHSGLLDLFFVAHAQQLQSKTEVSGIITFGAVCVCSLEHQAKVACLAPQEGSYSALHNYPSAGINYPSGPDLDSLLDDFPTSFCPERCLNTCRPRLRCGRHVLRHLSGQKIDGK